MKQKKIISAVLALMLAISFVLTMMPGSAFAGEAPSGYQGTVYKKGDIFTIEPGKFYFINNSPVMGSMIKMAYQITSNDISVDELVYNEEEGGLIVTLSADQKSIDFVIPTDRTDDPLGFTTSGAGTMTDPIIFAAVYDEESEKVYVEELEPSGYESATLIVGETDSFSVRVLPGNATETKVVFSSTDEKVVTVDSESGEFTAVGAGEAAIIATAVNDPEVAEDDVTYSFPVMVLAKFVDVPDDAYYYEPVYWAVKNGVTTGITKDKFKPFTVCNRAQTITFIWRANGCPEPESTENPFTDVDPEAFYYKAVLWGIENEIVAGKTATTFAPNDPCTRSQVVLFLWRDAGCPVPETTVNPFTDVQEGSAFYNAILWASENNITQGVKKDVFGIKSSCVRAQLITFIYRALGPVEETE